MNMIKIAAFLLAASGFMTIRSAQALDALSSGESGGRPALMLGVNYDLTGSRLFSDNSTPRYQGGLIKIRADYQIGTQSFSIGPYLSYLSGELENSGNNNLQREFLKIKSYSAGLKTYLDIFYIYVGYSLNQHRLNSTGQIERAVTMNGSGPESGVGLSFTFFSYFVLSLGADVSYASYPANEGGLTSKTSHLRYGGTVGLSFVLPSGQSASKKKRLTFP
jgi:hypothetical protein